MDTFDAGHLLWLRAMLLLLFGTSLVTAQAPEKRFNITATDVAYALSLAGVRAGTDEIRLQAAVLASQPGPRLRLEGREQVGPLGVRFRFSCADSGVCLPFYALVAGQEGAPGKASSGSGSGATAQLPTRPVPPTLHAGSQATLFLENHFMRISLPVILIDTGRAGSEVRVASLDRKQTYHAKVFDDGTVHGDLP